MTHRNAAPLTENAEPSQAAVVALLADPMTHGGNAVVRIDTPISHVFIAGPRTYKLKRAVKRNFVDYSTPEKRLALCEREVAVNIKSAPGIYKGVVPITETGDGLRLGGKGKAVDYAVEMVTFDPDQAFDRLADNGKLRRSFILELADIIAELHASAPQTKEFGGAQTLAEIIREVAEETLNSRAGERLAKEAGVWREAAETALGTHAEQLNARKRHGYVRRCHGDLHLGNICLFEGRPTPFDAIEFSEEIASVDILYDLAFTIMDLLHRGLTGHANILLSRYLNFTRDYSGLSLMPLFVSLRAAVRAMVAASSDDLERGASEARTRLRFASQALAGTPSPLLIAVGGLSGSGKSTLARRLAPEIPGLCGAVTIRSDVCRKRLYGVSPEAPLPASAYTPHVSKRVYRLMLRDAGRALRAGTSVILDATFIEGNETGSLERLAKQSGARFTGLWLSLELGALQERIRRRGADASDATPAVAADQWERVRANPAWVKLDASRPIDQVTAEARACLGI